jgi:hypothetical protein
VGVDAIIYIPNLTKIGSGIQEFIGGYKYRQQTAR